MIDESSAMENYGSTEMLGEKQFGRSFTRPLIMPSIDIVELPELDECSPRQLPLAPCHSIVC
jgi:hypothetical protein